MTTAGETASATASASETATATATETSSPTAPAVRLREAPDGAPSGDPADAGDVPHPEHPRPDLVRRHWRSLNGPWRFAFDPADAGEQGRWYRLRHPGTRPAGSGDGPANLGTSMLTAQGVADPFVARITVPFPWESRLSGIGDTAYKGVAWYQRELVAPPEWAAADGAGWRLRPHLYFGAVDWNAKVWVDARFVGEHDGGYTPFAFDLGAYLRPGRPSTLTVRVLDTCAADTLIGKQTDRWYTHSGGIWQSVILEGRPAAFVERVDITPDLPGGKATFAVRLDGAAPGAAGAYRLAVASADGAFPEVARAVAVRGARTEATLEVAVPGARAWSPEDPHLYDCVVSLTPAAPPADAADAGAAGDAAGDAVGTYFGLRTVATGRWGGKPYEYVLLNGAPVYLRGALDQAFHPEGLHAYPSDAAVRADVAAAKALGLNLLRCHIKVNDPRYYYWCDRLGVLCMYDLPSASIYTPRARANWEQTFRAALARDYNHPCVFAWILFNETWGLEEHQTPESWRWVREMYDLAKALDRTRLVEDNSACLYDHVVSDINTWHFYLADYGRAKRHVERVVAQTYEGSPFNYVGHLYAHDAAAAAYRQSVRPLLNSEYAGLSARMGDRDVSYSFKFLTTELRRHDKICGYVYTELADIEWEHNGLLEYDRTEKRFGYDRFVPQMTVADLNAADVVGLDAPPCRTLPPGSVFRAQAFVSHWDARPVAAPLLRWRVSAVDRFGEALEVDAGERRLSLEQYGVVDGGPIEARLPDEPCLVTVALWLIDGAGGDVRARNYVNVDVHSRKDLPAAGGDLDDLAPEVLRTARGYAVRFAPEAFDDTSWPRPITGRGQAKLGAPGAGWVEYRLPLPEGVRAPGARLRGLRLRFEAGARTARARLSWPDHLHVLPTDYPQTEARRRPSSLSVSVNGVLVGQTVLADDPADAAGVLSLHLNEDFECASYGELITLAAGAEETAQILAAAGDGGLTVRFEVPRDGVRGGLNLYGDRMGATPVAPTLFLDLE